MWLIKQNESEVGSDMLLVIFTLYIFADNLYTSNIMSIEFETSTCEPRFRSV